MNINLDEINCFYLCGCSKEILQDGSFDDAHKLVIAVDTSRKELILICVKIIIIFFQKTFECEVFFEETKKCLIEMCLKDFVKIEIQIVKLL